ncbi:MAG: aspartate aminotransferase family protein [Bacteroidetes bacterium]|nr:aspartate aminotransferase family protein [Bacteroidota bacterium]
MKHWKKLSAGEQDRRITEALEANIDFEKNLCLGIPASRLDSKVFYEGASFLKDAPLLRSYVQNPNHIGCHTMGDSEPFFAGTQALEREVISILSEDLMKASPDSCDGYVAGGGTEANIQAAWMYRNLFMHEHGARHDQIALISSADTHYSVAKAANLLHLRWLRVPVNEDSREIQAEALRELVQQAQQEGIRYFIVFANMATTMFGSVDNPELICQVFAEFDVPFRMHVDGAFGGFIYPVSCPENKLDFRNPCVSSVTLDAHKMLQAPYGTGVFLVRKGLMQHVYTEEAQYVNGMDITLSGSRSGANAIAVWMILMTYGPFGYLEKINKLLYRTSWCCEQLDTLGIRYYRHPRMNIITLNARQLNTELAKKFGLVPDTHHGDANWYKIVVMDHVELDQLEAFIQAIRIQTVPAKIKL